MAAHPSTLAWRIPWAEEPGGLQSMELLGVRHDWATSLSLSTFMHCRRKWQPTRVLAWRIPGTGEPGGLPSMGSHRVGHDWSDLAAAASTPKNAPWSSHDNSPSQYMHTSLFNIERWDNQTSTHERMKFLPTSQHVQMTAQMDQRSKLKS